MFLVPHIKSMMYIPLNCAIIAQVYYESQSSHHLAIPRTRTQLYKALTHSPLVRHMKMKESKGEYSSMLPEGLDEENIKSFKTLAKFAFDSYHKGYSRKVTFFKEDIPEGFVHFGFMNESTEMYAGKGVEQTFSFLHLSLQEYLAAWHLADSYSIEFQVAYHRIRGVASLFPRCPETPPPGSKRKGEGLKFSVQRTYNHAKHAFAASAHVGKNEAAGCVWFLSPGQIAFLPLTLSWPPRSCLPWVPHR